MQGEKILIVGGGTWGCSTALELARRGYKNITVLEASPFPSPIAAGNDLNKIAEESPEPRDGDSDDDYFWRKILQMAMQAWKTDPLFKPFYHATGMIMAAVGDDAYKHCIDFNRAENELLIPLNTKEGFQCTMPTDVLTGAFPGWRGFWKIDGAGWVFARGALKAMHAEAVKLGVDFITGPSEGRVGSLLYSERKDVVMGARTADGREHVAIRTILAAGANSDLLLDFKKQLRPTAWTLAHIPLSKDEAAKYRNLPVLYGVDRGFFIEPDEEKHEIKLCDEHPGYLNMTTVNGELRSVPFAREQIPKEAEARMRRFLRETMPQFEERPFSFARICWDADPADRRFLIDQHPGLKGLTVAVGGSGMGFMTCPAIGVLVADTLEGKVDARLKSMLKWRPETADQRNWWDAQDRFGADGKVMDFDDVKEWTTIEPIS